MKQHVALRILGEVLGWDNTRARQEFAWLSLMSRMKYDGYRDFLVGVRFIESLADWLQQFDSTEDRTIAYEFVRQQLVYIGSAEMQHLVELVYPEIVQRRLVEAVAKKMNIPSYLVWAQADAAKMFCSILRHTLFLGLSDGARIDTFRRINAGIISNEQILVGTQLDSGKWKSILDDLRTATGDPNAKFQFVYLLDDFVGSGKTLLRKDDEEGNWKGKLFRFWEQVHSYRATHFAPDFALCIHHYIATSDASTKIVSRNGEILRERGTEWFQSVKFTFGTVLPETLRVDDARFPDFAKLLKKYYDKSIETGHTEVGGTDMRFGFGGCGLPLILEHNTPNNSITLLWAETSGGEGIHAMRPLFRRRQRHS